MQFKQMFVTAVCVLLLLKLKWPSQRIFIRWAFLYAPKYYKLVGSCKNKNKRDESYTLCKYNLNLECKNFAFKLYEEIHVMLGGCNRTMDLASHPVRREILALCYGHRR